MALATAIPSRAVLADLLPAADSRLGAALRELGLVAGGAALTGLAAQLSLPVPGSPVPVTGQTFAALLVGTALGARRGAASLALYLLAGASGLPWFAEHSSGWVLPTLGYVLGFVLAAALTGLLARRGGDRTPLRVAGVMVLGNLAIYAVGAGRLAARVPGQGRRPGPLPLPAGRRPEGAAGDGRAAAGLAAAGRAPLLTRGCGPDVVPALRRPGGTRMPDFSPCACTWVPTMPDSN